MTRNDISKHHVLIAEYTLGLLNPHETTRAHKLLSESDEAIAVALDWEDSLLDLADVLPALDPSPLLLQRIQTTLGHDTTPAPSRLYRKPAATMSSAADEPAVATNTATTQAPTHVPASGQTDNAAQANISASLPAYPQAKNQAPSLKPSTKNPEPAEQADSLWPRTRHTRPQPAAPRREPSFGATPENDVAATAAAPVNTTHTYANHERAAEQLVAGSSDQSGISDRVKAGASDRVKPSDSASTIQAAPASATAGASIPITPPSVPRQPKPTHKSVTDNVWIWRAATVIFAGIALVLAVIPSQPAQPPVNIVTIAPTQAAILQAPGQTSTPGWVVTFDLQGNALMKPQVRSDIPADASVQLWTRSASMPQARSLGLIDPNLPVTVPASLMGTLGEDQLFEMTLEPHGGSPDASPSGPILFIGQVITFGAQKPATNAQDAASVSNDSLP
ncbi:anti-sigma factor domain-containing protein [Allopusillimonas ginsengisoli]|uniref:anti-sigma factor domain-containing protein n=1 Tax=Allopusillimonas ginsengisoli TaxID=453575 RepID=UPI0010C1FC02|nr:hypothetical protein D7I39_20645 [Allopusillimonas ginsengisoli]